jgi:hypothetical protein
MNVDDLFGALRGIPHLPDARCGLESAELFDEYEDSGIVSAAKAICDRCAARAACSEFVASLPLSKRPLGTTAGVCRRPRQSRKSLTA